MRITAILLAAAIVSPTLAQSQSQSTPSQPPNVYQPSMSAVVAVQPATVAPSLLLEPRHDDEAVVSSREFSSRAPGGAMIILGSAALLAGLLTNGSGSTALIVAGIGFGAYGVYLYTQ